MTDYTKIRRPAVLTAQEITQKLEHLSAVLKSAKKTGVLLVQEGAMRWLSGTRHQIIDMTPADISPVNALCMLKGKIVEITFVTAPFEMDRIKDELPLLFKGVKGCRVKFSLNMPKLVKGVVVPAQTEYHAIVGKIVRPLVGGLTGNQYKKYDWVANMANVLTAEVAHELKPGMTATQVRAMIFERFAFHGLETNMILIAFKGQGGHLHPLYADNYKVAKNCWLKLITAGRHADVIVSETTMVKIGKASKAELVAYAALQEAALEYCDLYRNGVNEQELYSGCGKRFKMVEKKYGIKGFGKSAYLHHMGGPTSPLGNRDYCLTKENNADCFAGMSFAINPVECLFGTKVELQGIVQVEGAPHMLDISKYTPEKLMGFREITTQNGTCARVAEPILL